MARHKKTPLALLRFYREHYPACWPVKLRWVEKCEENALATCSLQDPRRKRPYFLIELSATRLAPFRDTWWIVRETVMHEYAHAMSWTPAHKNHKDHGPLFGVAYAQLYEPTLSKFPDGDL